MEALRKYILSVTAAAILFSILQSLLDKKNGNSVLLRLIGGLFLAFTIIAPIAEVKIDHLLDIPLDFSIESNDIAAQSYDTALSEMHDIIKERCEAYILDKASAYQVKLNVDVTLTHSEIPIPSAVQLQGSVSPYVKTTLQTWIWNEMGISKENQLWIE